MSFPGRQTAIAALTANTLRPPQGGRVGLGIDYVEQLDAPPSPAELATPCAHAVRAVDRYLTWHWNTWRHGLEPDSGVDPEVLDDLDDLDETG